MASHGALNALAAWQLAPTPHTTTFPHLNRITIKRGAACLHTWFQSLCCSPTPRAATSQSLAHNAGDSAVDSVDASWDGIVVVDDFVDESLQTKQKVNINLGFLTSWTSSL